MANAEHIAGLLVRFQSAGLIEEGVAVRPGKEATFQLALSPDVLELGADEAQKRLEELGFSGAEAKLSLSTAFENDHKTAEGELVISVDPDRVTQALYDRAQNEVNEATQEAVRAGLTLVPIKVFGAGRVSFGAGSKETVSDAAEMGVDQAVEAFESATPEQIEKLLRVAEKIHQVQEDHPRTHNLIKSFITVVGNLTGAKAYEEYLHNHEMQNRFGTTDPDLITSASPDMDAMISGADVQLASAGVTVSETDHVAHGVSNDAREQREQGVVIA